MPVVLRVERPSERVPRMEPLVEPDRFFPAPSRSASAVRELEADAQTAALSRLLQRCDRIRPHLQSAETLEQLIQQYPDPARVRRRISVALALEHPDRERFHGLLMPGELEAFRKLARQKLAACVWVFA